MTPRVLPLGEDVQVLDLESERHPGRNVVDDTISRVVQLRQSRAEVTPCVVVLVPCGFRAEDSQRLVRAGAYVRGKPVGFAEAVERNDSDRALQLLFGADEADLAFQNPTFRAGGAKGAARPDNLRIYESPPYQLSDEDYRRWIERMRMPLEEIED